MTQIYLAVDGGATKTFAAVYSTDGEILGIGVSGPSNYRNIGESAATDNIRDAATKAMDSASLNPSELKGSTYAIAGVKDSDRSTEIIKGIVDKTKVTGNFSLYNDAEAGFYSRFLDGDGIILAPGTGMISYCRYGGKMERASGWGWLIGDEGGAFFIGKTAISMFAKTSDHRLEYDSGLHDRIAEMFGIAKDRDLVNHIYSNPINIRKIASVAVIVSELANAGNELCRDIILSASYEAAQCAVALHRSMKIEGKIELSGYGGVFRSGTLYWNNIMKTVSENTKGVSFREPIYGYHAVVGSILMKLKAEGVEVKETDIDPLVRSIDNLVSELPTEDREKYLFIN